MAERSTDIEVNARIDEIFTLLLNGTRRAEIIQFAADKWGVGDRQVDTYIKRAGELMEEAAETRRKREYGRALLRLDDLYQKTLRIQDYARSLAVQAERSRLLGLYAPTRTELSGPDGGPVAVSGADFYAKAIEVATRLRNGEIVSEGDADAEAGKPQAGTDRPDADKPAESPAPDTTDAPANE